MKDFVLLCRLLHHFLHFCNPRQLVLRKFWVVFNHELHLFFNDSAQSQLQLLKLFFIFFLTFFCLFLFKFHFSHCCFLPQTPSCCQGIRNLFLDSNPLLVGDGFCSLPHDILCDPWSLISRLHPMTMFFRRWEQVFDLLHSWFEDPTAPSASSHQYLLQKGWKSWSISNSPTSVESVSIASCKGPHFASNFSLLE